MAKIRYIGKKERKTDTPAIAGTGTIWNGPGDVQEVTDKKAVAKLLDHTDSFELAEDESSTLPDPEKTADETTDEKPGLNEMSESDARPPMANLETMNADALRTYAQRWFGHEFHHKTGEAKMRDTIIGLMNRG